MPVRRRAAATIDLLPRLLEMFPVHTGGLFEGYRFFPAFEYLFIYLVSTSQIQVLATAQGRMIFDATDDPSP